MTSSFFLISLSLSLSSVCTILFYRFFVWTMIICRIRGFQSALMAIWIELSWLRYTLVVFLFQIVVSTDCVLSLWVSRKSTLKIATLFFDYNTPTLINIIRSPMILMNSSVEISFLVILMWFYYFIMPCELRCNSINFGVSAAVWN